MSILHNPLSKSSMSQRSSNVVMNTFASAIMKIITLLCSLIIVPITIDYLTPEYYGIWIAMTSILYWFVFFDVGLGNGMRNYLAEAISLGKKDLAKSYFSTAIILLSGIALLIGLISVPLVYSLDLCSIFNTKMIDNDTLANILLIAIMFSLLQFVAKTIGMVFIALQKYAINDLITFTGTILTVIVVYIFTKTVESSLMKIVIVFTGIPFLVTLLAAIPLFRKYPELSPSFKSMDIAVARQVVFKGLGFFLIQITSCLVIFGSANIFISHYCGPEQVTVYNVAYKLFNILITVFTIMISPLWSAYTDASAKQDYRWIRRTFRKTLYLWGLSLIGGLFLLAISSWFFKKWVGDSVSVPFEVSCCILLYVCFFNLNNCATYLINGLNKIKVQMITSIIFTLIYLVSIYYIGGTFGIVGITLAMTGAYVLMSVIHLYQCHLFLSHKASGIWDK